MRCDEARLALYALEDGELDPQGSGDVLAHLERCEACRLLRAADRRVRALARWQATTMPGAPPDLWSRVAARIEAEDVSRAACVGPRWPWARRVAVAAAAGIILALFGATNPSPPPSTPAGLADQLVADHERSLRRAAGPADVPSGDPAVILARLGPTIGRIAREPTIETAGAALVGGSVCQLRGTRGIRWSYRIDGARPLSFYQLAPLRRGDLPPPDAGRRVLAAASGTPAILLWADHRSLHALVGALTDGELQRLAARTDRR